MEEIILSDHQNAAVAAVKAWLDTYDGSKPFFYLAGYAGTGKTSIAKVLAAQQPGLTKFACATGKAARVLTRKGCPAGTCHSLIYLPLGDINDEIKELQAKEELIATALKEDALKPEEERMPKGKRQKMLQDQEKFYARITKLRQPVFQLNELTKNDDFDDDYGTRKSRRGHPLANVILLLLDEVSMLNEEVARDLMSFKIPMVVLGDPGQLPPVQGTGYFTDREPDFMLTEIHRQAADNPIIKIATTFREGRTPSPGKYGDSRITTRYNLKDTDYLEADQIICGSNKTRVTLNNKMRELKGFSGVFPQKGERLICLRNNKQEQIFNGQIFTVTEDFDELNKWIKVVDDEGREKQLIIHPECFTRPTQVTSWDYTKRAKANEFDFAYAVTCHKFQGSEEPKILVFADAVSWMRDKGDLKKWCYTAATRAADFWSSRYDEKT